MNKDIVALLKEATKDLLTEQHLNDIKVAFDQAVESKSKILIESALIKQDEEYTQKLQKLLAAVDEDYSKKLQRVVEAIDKSNTQKLMTVIERYEKLANQDAKAFKHQLTESLSKYLDVYLEEKIPAQEIKEATQNKKSQSLLDEIRKLLAVDLAMATESIREAVLDGKTQLQQLQAVATEADVKVRALTEENERLETRALIAEKISTVPEDKREYMKRMLTGKDRQYITENFDYILNLHDKTEEEALQTIKEQAILQTNSHDAAPVLQESATSEQKNVDPLLNTYMAELKKI